MEIEAKFDIVTPEEVTLERVLSALEEVGVQSTTMSKAVSVLDTYYDTDDLALYRAGAGLRVRRKAEKTVLTLKVQGVRSGAVFSRQELEGKPDVELLGKIHNVLLQHGFLDEETRVDPERIEDLGQFADWGLKPVVAIQSERRKCILARDEDFAELSYDQVFFVHADQSHAHPSLEVEALEDRFESDILDLAGFLQRTFGSALAPQASSKYELAVAAFHLDQH